MTPEFAAELLKTMIFNAIMLAAPLLLCGMAIGLCVSLFQAVTSISEQTLTFVPKALGVISLLLILLPWMFRTVMEFTIAVVQKLPDMVG